MKILIAAVAALALSSCLILDGSFDDRELMEFGFATDDNPGLRKAYAAEIDEDARTLNVSIPDYADATALVPSFSFDGVAVRVDGVLQVSGESAQDFTRPLTYSVLGKDDKTTDYRVAVQIVPPSSDKSFTLIGIGPAHPDEKGGFWMYDSEMTTSLDGILQNLSEADLSRLYVAFKTGGVGVSAGATALEPASVVRYDYYYYGSRFRCEPYSAANWLDFSSPVVFTVTAEDNSTATYTADLTAGAQ
jgi:hypothetical protein